MSSQILSQPLPYLALLIAHLIWGASFVVAKITLQEFPPNSLALFRFVIATLLIAPFFIAEREKVKLDPKDTPKLIAIGVFIITLNISFFFQGIVRTDAINASVLTLTIPMLSVLLGWLILKEKIYIINLAGVVLGLIGALVIIGLPNLLLGTLDPTKLWGNFLIVLACISWVVGAVFSKQMLKKYSSLTITGISFAIGAITFIIPALFEYIQNPDWPSQITLLGILGLIYMVLLSSISAYFLFEWGLAKTSVYTADILQYVEPFIAAILAVLILGETVTWPFLLGVILISAGVYMGTLAKEAHHRHHKAHRI